MNPAETTDMVIITSLRINRRRGGRRGVEIAGPARIVNQPLPRALIAD